jgi:tetratricopeptide (TPR) repeat protein|tara:strand:+ start:1705 stop:3384 length:1680 start_codon:yes stop_codon:yes gene_type:complete
MTKIFQIIVLFLAVSIAEQGSASSGAYLAGRQAISDHNFVTASEFQTKSVSVDPSNSKLLEGLMISFIAQGSVDKAISIAEVYKDNGNQSQISQMILSASLIKDGRTEAFLSFIKDASKITPILKDLLSAWVLMGLNDDVNANRIFDKTAKVQGMGQFVNFHRAMSQLAAGKFEQALKTFNLIHSDKENPTRRSVISHTKILLSQSKFKEAQSLLEKWFGPTFDPEIEELFLNATNEKVYPKTSFSNINIAVADVFHSIANLIRKEADPTFTLIYSRLAEYLDANHIDSILMTADLLVELEQYNLAIKEHEKLSNSQPQYFASELGRAEALRSSGKEEAAVEVLAALTRQFPNSPNGFSILGNHYRRLEAYDRAEVAYKEAIKLYQAKGEAGWFLYYVRGITRERLNLWGLAEKDFRKALSLNPTQPQVLNYLGYSLIEKNTKLDEALDMIERAVKESPDSGYIVDSLGWGYYKLGEYEKAVPNLEKAAELMPIDPIVNDHLGDVYWMVGRKTEAEFQWRRALSFDPEEEEIQRIKKKLKVGLTQVLIDESKETGLLVK